MTWNEPGSRLLRYGAAADRGRIVREAIAVLLADLDARGKDSLLARRIASSSSASSISASSASASPASASSSSVPDQPNGTSEPAR